MEKTSQLLLLCLFNEVDFHDFLLVILISPIIILIYIDQMGAFVLKDGLAQELLEKGSPIPGIVFLRTGDGIIELNSIHASKGNALCTLCKKLGISMENVLAIGDNENDISMLQAAGISVAMENAEDDVKQAAKFVAGHNEEDGAAHFLEEWVL